jgi:hypothetical protein
MLKPHEQFFFVFFFGRPSEDVKILPVFLNAPRSQRIVPQFSSSRKRVTTACCPAHARAVKLQTC